MVDIEKEFEELVERTRRESAASEAAKAAAEAVMLPVERIEPQAVLVRSEEAPQEDEKAMAIRREGDRTVVRFVLGRDNAETFRVVGAFAAGAAAMYAIQTLIVVGGVMLAGYGAWMFLRRRAEEGGDEIIDADAKVR